MNCMRDNGCPMSLTTIHVSTVVRDRLKRLASKGEIYDTLLRRLIENAESRLLSEREKGNLVGGEFVPLSEA